MPLFYQPEISTGYLSSEESRHAVKVLRLKTGDEIEITDGKGNLYQAQLTDTDPRQSAFRIISTNPVAKRDFFIHLAIAPTKNMDRMEWMVEKCVEIGIEKITFLVGKKSERKTISLERLEKILISAMKQSGQTRMPLLEEMVPFEKFIDGCRESQKFIGFVNKENPDYLKNLAKPDGEYAVLVGPEGDFTKEEVAMANKNGFRTVSLGPHRLRTETAGLIVCCTLNLINS